MASFKAILSILVLVALTQCHAATLRQFLKSLANGNVVDLFEDCGDEKTAMRFSKFQMTPEYLTFLQDSSISFGGSLSRDVVAPVKADIKLQKKDFDDNFVDMTICYQGVLGTCVIADICEKADVCPFHQGERNVNSLLNVYSIDQRLQSVPIANMVGFYKLHVELTDNQGQVACLKSRDPIEIRDVDE